MMLRRRESMRNAAAPVLLVGARQSGFQSLVPIAEAILKWLRFD